jgi:hypothetical protein
MSRLAVLCSLLAAVSPSLAATPDLRAEFLALESKLMVAAMTKQADVQKDLVSPDFAWSMALEGRPNEVMTRAEWLKGIEYYDLKEFEINHLTAQELGKITVTHFRFTRSATIGTGVDVSGELVITDLWQKGGAQWQLLRRFVSRAALPPGGK